MNELRMIQEFAEGVTIAFLLIFFIGVVLLTALIIWVWKRKEEL